MLTLHDSNKNCPGSAHVVCALGGAYDSPWIFAANFLTSVWKSLASLRSAPKKSAEVLPANSAAGDCFAPHLGIHFYICLVQNRCL